MWYYTHQNVYTTVSHSGLCNVSHCTATRYITLHHSATRAHSWARGSCVMHIRVCGHRAEHSSRTWTCIVVPNIYHEHISHRTTIHVSVLTNLNMYHCHCAGHSSRTWTCIVVQNIYHEHKSHRHKHEHVSSYDLSYDLPYGRHAHGMGWLRLVGSLKLQVAFAEYSLFYRSLLQKRPMILRSLLIVATPYDSTNTRQHAHV